MRAATLNRMDRTTHLDRFRTGFDDVVDALAAITPDELDRRPPDGWSAREIAHHLADSEATAYVRLRRLIAEDNPAIIGYDEEEFARRLHYDRPIEPSLAVLAGVRDASLQLLESLTDAEWQRTGTHSDSGTYSVDDWLRIYAGHSHDHADQIRRARRGEA
jgi:DinB superfamily